MAKCCQKTISFFSIVQWIYTQFVWELLKTKVLCLTLKPLSKTRWECHIESVKAIHYQSGAIRDDLLEVSENCSDPKIKSESKSLNS